MICRCRPSCYNRGRSPPHGGADRNNATHAEPVTRRRRPLTGARIETLTARTRRDEQRPSPLHGGADRNITQIAMLPRWPCGRPLTGARIETPSGACCVWRSGRPLTGARIETGYNWPRMNVERSRSLPSRGRGSKQSGSLSRMALVPVAPFTGARIETDHRADRQMPTTESPLHGGADRNMSSRARGRSRSPPHGGADRNTEQVEDAALPYVAPSRGRGSKRHGSDDSDATRPSPPHGGADRNRQIGVACEQSRAVAPSRGRGSKRS